MAISVTNIGIASGKTATQLSISIGVGGVPAGALIVVAVLDGNTAGSMNAVSDTASNVYAAPIQASPNNAAADGRFAMQYTYNCAALVSGNTITYTPIGANGASISAFYATGIERSFDPRDSSAAGTGTGSSAIPTATLGSVPAVAGSLVVGIVATNGPTGDTFTQDSTHAAYATPPTRSGTSGGAAGSNFTVAGGNVVSSSALTYAPAITSRPWFCLAQAFKPQLGPEPSLTGVAGTGAAGSFKASPAANVTGVSGTSAAGSINGSSAANITGVAATGQVAALNGGAFHRPSTATYLDGGGNLISVGNDVLRPNYSGGIATGALIEGFATNVVTNPRAEGAVVGTVGSGGVYPTGWGTFAGAGLSRQIVGSGYVNGIPYCDIRYFGTSSGTTFFVDAFQVTATAAPSQVWTASFWLALVGGSISNITSFFIEARSNNNPGDVAITPTGTLTRYQGSLLTTSGTTAMSPCLHFEMPIGTAVDFTFRFGAPQCELVSNTGNLVAGVAANNGSATSVILPPIGSPAATTRAADTVGFSRASTANYFDYTGTLTSAVANFLRPAYDATGNQTGNLIEAAATNAIRNNTMAGAVAGSPGTAPTFMFGWGNQGGLTQTIVGTGTENGMSYIDVRFNGTTSVTGIGPFFEAITGIAAVNGQTWTLSAYLKLVGGSLTNISGFQLLWQELDSGSGFLTTHTSPNFTPTGSGLTTQRQTYTFTNNQATTAFVLPAWEVTFASGVAVDFTLRVGMPQMELGSAATSVITTSGAAATRAADTYTALGIPLIMAPVIGVSATGQVGTLGLPGRVPITGVSGTGQVGTLIGEVDSTITGVSATGRVGTLSTAMITLVNIGTASNQTGATLSVTTPTVPAGSLIVAMIHDGNLTGANPTAPTDTAGNTYNLSKDSSVDGLAQGVSGLRYAFNSLALASGNTISYVPVTAGGASISIFYATGIKASANPYDTAASATNSGLSSAPHGTMLQAPATAGSLILGFLATWGPSTDSFTQDTSLPWGAPPPTRVGTTGGSSNMTVAGGWITGSAVVTYAPTITSENYNVGVHVFAPAPAPVLSNITGVSATGQVGTLIAEIDKPITGVAGSGQAGTITFPGGATVTLTGVAGTGQVGTLTTKTDDSASLTGVAATGQVGTLIAEIDTSIAGVFAAGQVGTLSGGTFSRASIATYLDAGNRNLVTVGNDILRPSYVGGVLKGALIEAAATNIITNNTGTGLVPGTPGTPPTNWTVTVGNGMSVQTIGSGVENGIAYVDIRWFGTAVGPASLTVVLDTTLTTTAGQTSTISLFTRTLPGSVVAVSDWTLDLTGATGAHLLTVGAPSTGVLPSQRFSVSGTAPSSGSITPQFALSSSNGATNDLTIRLGLAQVELGSSATSPIATSSGAVTRAADTVTGGIVVEMKPVTGVAGTGRVGTLTTQTDDSVTLTGVAATGQVGTLTGEIDLPIVGVVGTGQVGTAIAEIDGSVTLTGVAATGQVGTLTTEIDKSILGLAGTGQLGVVIAEIDDSILGVAATGQVGTLSTTSAQNATVTGVVGTGQVGTVIAEIDTALAGVFATGQAGTLSTTGGQNVSVTGVSATGQVGTLSTETDESATLIGVEATGQVGTLTVSGGGIVQPITGSGDEARRKYLDWKKQQRAKRKEAMKPPSKTPLQPSVPAPQQQPRTKPKILPQDVAALLLAKNLESQRAQLAQLESIDAQLIDGIVGQEQQDRDDEEAILLLLLTSI